MQESALVLLPPLIVLILGFWTRHVLFSLFCGILSAAFIATSCNPYNACLLAIDTLWRNFELYKLGSWESFLSAKNISLALFLSILGVIVTLIGHSGGAYAYALFVRSKVTTRRGAELSSLLLSSGLCVDDYFSSLTVGSVMQSLTDHLRIPRVKLAFLVDSMAAPLAIIAPVSSWVAAIVGFLGENGVSSIVGPGTLILAHPFSVYLDIIPFMFYTFIIVSGTLFIVIRRISFGKMGAYEKIAQETGNVFGGKEEMVGNIRRLHARNALNSSMIDFIAPISVLLLSVFSGILYTGDAWIFGGSRSIFKAFQHANPYQALLSAGIITLLFVVPFYLLRKRVTFLELPGAFWDGIKLMTPAVAILLLAWTLGDILRDNLHTGHYLAHLMLASVPFMLLPLVFFLASAAASFAIGSSWGTSALMFPIAIPMVAAFVEGALPVTPDQVMILFPVLGAILSGAVAGDHIAPISDTTIMSSTSTNTPHIDHVQTQLAYAVPMLIGTGVSFLLTGLLINYGTLIMIGISIPTGILTSWIILIALNSKKS